MSTATLNAKAPKLDKEAIREACRATGWDQVLAPWLTPDQMTPTHQPCPWCGGTDRYRAYDDFPATGGDICNQCGANPDGFATLAKCLGLDVKSQFREVLEVAAERVGCQGGQTSKPSATPATTQPVPVNGQPSI